MDGRVQVNEIDSRVQAMDSQALLSGPVLETIVREVLRRLREEQEREARAADERRLRRGVSAGDQDA
jgi:hypothetical protein